MTSVLLLLPRDLFLQCLPSEVFMHCMIIGAALVCQGGSYRDREVRSMFQRDLGFVLGLLKLCSPRSCYPFHHGSGLSCQYSQGYLQRPQAPGTRHWLYPCGLQKAHLLWL